MTFSACQMGYIRGIGMVDTFRKAEYTYCANH